MGRMQVTISKINKILKEANEKFLIMSSLQDMNDFFKIYLPDMVNNAFPKHGYTVDMIAFESAKITKIPYADFVEILVPIQITRDRLMVSDILLKAFGFSIIKNEGDYSTYEFWTGPALNKNIKSLMYGRFQKHNPFVANLYFNLLRSHTLPNKNSVIEVCYER